MMYWMVKSLIDEFLDLEGTSIMLPQKSGLTVKVKSKV